MSIKHITNEALKLSTGKHSVEISKNFPMDERVVEWFKKSPYQKNKNATRLYIPLDGDIRVNPDPSVMNTLIQRGVVVNDYLKGLAKDRYGRPVRIGKILKDDPEILKRYNNDPAREFARHARNGLYVVLSRHPYDVAGSSTDRRWTSCFDMGHDTDRVKGLPVCDIAFNTIVAYMVTKDDLNIKEPLSRIRITPEYLDGNNIRYHVDRAYGFDLDEFRILVNDIVYQLNDYLGSHNLGGGYVPVYRDFNSAGEQYINSIEMFKMVYDRLRKTKQYHDSSRQIFDLLEDAIALLRKNGFSDEYVSELAPFFEDSLEDPIIIDMLFIRPINLTLLWLAVVYYYLRQGRDPNSRFSMIEIAKLLESDGHATMMKKEEIKKAMDTLGFRAEFRKPLAAALVLLAAIGNHYAVEAVRNHDLLDEDVVNILRKSLSSVEFERIEDNIDKILKHDI